MSFALDGVRVLELARYQAEPRGGMILSDLGAEVIKVEPLGGEETRRQFSGRWPRRPATSADSDGYGPS